VCHALEPTSIELPATFIVNGAGVCNEHIDAAVENGTFHRKRIEAKRGGRPVLGGEIDDVDLIEDVEL
jgi:hypothetical protein